MFKFFTENGASLGVCRFFANDFYSVENATDIDAVSARLQTAQQKRSKGIFIGVVDKDKRKQPFFEKFNTVFDKAGVTLKKLDNLHVIILAPQVDVFIYTNAAEVSIDLSKIKFPSERKKFIGSLKTYNIENAPNFKTLLNDLKQKKCSCFLALREAFDYIYSQK